jgi:hypothetical protein
MFYIFTSRIDGIGAVMCLVESSKVAVDIVSTFLRLLYSLVNFVGMVSIWAWWGMVLRFWMIRLWVVLGMMRLWMMMNFMNRMVGFWVVGLRLLPVGKSMHRWRMIIRVTLNTVRIVSNLIWCCSVMIGEVSMNISTCLRLGLCSLEHFFNFFFEHNVCSFAL